MSRRLAFLCLGVMGYPMAGHLSRAGNRVAVYNRTTARARAWVEEFGGEWGATPAEAVREADVVLLCCGDDPDVREVVLGAEGALGAMRRDACLVDHTTASPALARELDERARDAGLRFLDAPVSGGQSGAETGALTIMVGGDEAVCASVSPLLDCYAKRHRWMGPAGSGQLTKMVNQICIAGIVQGLSEALHFAKRAGLDPQGVVDVISQGAAQSWQMDNRAETMAEGSFEFGFAVDWMRKDLRIALDEARRMGARLPVTALVDQLYAAVQARGGARWDTSSLITLLED